MATGHKKRVSSRDGDETIEDSKRVCVDSLRDPLGNSYSSSNFDGFWDAETGIVNPSFQFVDTTPQVIDGLQPHLGSQFETDPFASSCLLPNFNENFGAGDNFLDTGLTPQSLGFGPSFPSVTDTSQYDYNAYPLTYLIQTQQTNDLGYCWGTDIYDPNTDLCVDTAASLKYQTAHFVPIEAQNTDIDSISRTEDATTKNTTAEMEIEAEIETEGSTEWSCLENKVHSLEPESIVNTETQSGQQTPNASEPGLTALDNDFPSVPHYDTCFGVVTVTAMSSFKKSSGMNSVPVSIAAYGDMLKLSFQDSNKYAGLINSPTLSKLLKECRIQLNATLAAPENSQDKASKAKKSYQADSTRECLVRIVIYGLASERATVGVLLSDAGLYLQHPSQSEYDRNVEYINPQFLLRPGAHMPELEQLSINASSTKQNSSESWDEANKSRVLRIFDLANEAVSSVTIKPSSRLRSTLQSHQLKALAMMIEKELGISTGSTFPPLWEEISSNDGTTRYRHRVTGASEISPRLAYGGILADEMGLGKTLSFLALVCWSLDYLANQVVEPNDYEPRVTLLIAPKSTIPGWLEQIRKHIHDGQLKTMTYYGSARERLSKDLKNVDIVLTTYETMRSDWTAKGALYSVKWHRIVLDEAHHIRTRSSQTFRAACAVQARHRWCLTGTPIQNSLDDYGALLSFIGVHPFTDKSAFNFWITESIKQNRPHSLQRLENLVRATCLRRTKSLNSTLFKLPERSEKIEWIELFPEDRDLYKFFKMKTAKIASELSQRNSSIGKSDQQKETNILTLINFLRLICDHGEHLLPSSALEAWTARGSGSIDWQMMLAQKAKCDVCGVYVEELGASVSKNLEYECQHSICLTCAIGSQKDEVNDGLTCPKCTEGIGLNSQQSNKFIRPSAKIEKLIQNIRKEQLSGCEGDPFPRKSVVFSSWTKMLDLVQHHLESNGFTLQRIDGQSSLSKRDRAISQFSKDPKCTVMLASIGSAGEGINLLAANHVHLLEPHWNPMAEAQAEGRVHRIGQSREVLTTRYITRDSIETYVQWVQKEKIRVISQSLDFAHVSQKEIDEQRWKKLKSYMDST